MKGSSKGVGIGAAVTVTVTAVLALLTTEPESVSPKYQDGLPIEGIEEIPDQPQQGSTFEPPFETSETLTVEYQVVPFTRDGFGAPGTAEEEVAAARTRLARHRGEGYALRPPGGSWGPALPLSVATERFTDKLRGAERNEVYLVKALSDGYKEKGRKVDTNPLALSETSGNHAIDLIVGTTQVEFPGVRNLGVFVCKKISGTNTYSQHAWQNAVDFGGPGPYGSDANIALLDNVEDYLTRLWNAGILPVSQIGWRNWPNHYPGHMHVSGAPFKTGTPPCA